MQIVEASLADVEVVVARAPAAGADAEWRVTFTGRGPLAGQNRTLSLPGMLAVASAEFQTALTRIVKLGLTEFALSTAAGRYLDVTFSRPENAAPKQTEHDPWNYWVFRLGASADSNGEQFQSSASYYFNASANRVTENWKIRLSSYRSLNRSSFQLDEATKIDSRLSDWNVDSLVVKSLGPKWSLASVASVVGSSFSNSKLVLKWTPGIEFDVFPYAESSKRSLTFQYTVGPAHYDFEKLTIFDKFSETIALQSIVASLGLQQPWGQAGGTMTFTQHLNALERTRLTMNGSFSIRLLRSLSLNASGSYARIRDLFALEKGEATDEEVLLRQRQLATGFRYSFNVGLSYSFGALANTAVNPRFGG